MNYNDTILIRMDWIQMGILCLLMVSMYLSLLQEIRKSRIKPTTVEDWLLLLPPLVRFIAIDNARAAGCLKNKHDNFHDALALAFNWKLSPQGYDFWKEIERKMEYDSFYYPKN